MNRKSVVALGASAAALIAATTMAAGPVQAHDSRAEEKTVTLTAKLRQLNGSGASGTATAVVRGETIKHIEVHARGLTPDAPHAQHIHYGEQAMNECPTLKLDVNKDGRLTTVEGVPAYGPVVVSLNTTGDTTPASFLDVARFPVSKDGRYNYSRNNIKFTDVAGTGYPGAGGLGTAKQIADAVRDGEGVLVIHGLDYDENGIYNFSSPEGASELNPDLPAEATDPAVCGVLEER
ncbi:Cu/Zn superoxide dismutase [Pseudarthrobacter siccitolerans]|uniref:Cu/Zn superoxide dismutase n=1 Tax=Pseudarthrobacter siccitolerans TaxID=861266 RepID=A0ABU0PJ33_9MICC|nr:Cu/Zn superoxide dismutase [Pseudarthrobacter siccitolerans]